LNKKRKSKKKIKKEKSKKKNQKRKINETCFSAANIGSFMLF